MAKPLKQNQEYSDEETARRRDAVLKRMLEMPPKPRLKRTRGTKPNKKSPAK